MFTNSRKKLFFNQPWRMEVDPYDVFEENEFWTASSSLEQLDWLRMVGADGEEWIFEGWRNGQYIALAAWSPDEEISRAAYALDRLFVKFLPEQFALEVTRAWAVDFGPEVTPRFGEIVDLGAIL